MNSRLLLFQPISNYIFGLHSYISDNFFVKEELGKRSKGISKMIHGGMKNSGIHLNPLVRFE